MTDPARLRAVLERAGEAVARRRQLAGVDIAAVRSAEDYSRLVPLATRSDGPFAELLRGGRPAPGTVLMPSSGTSGRVAALGLSGAEPDAVDGAIRAFFETDRRRTLLLSVLPAGVSVSAPSCVSLSVGTRTDLAISALLRLMLPPGGEALEQVIVVAEPLYAAHLLRVGRAAGLDWSEFGVHLALGGTFLPRGLRRVLRGLLGAPPADALPRRILSSFGAGEVGLNLLFETPSLAAAHDGLHAEEFEALTGLSLPSPPLVFAYDPERLHLEGVVRESLPELVLTLLDADRARPVLRHPTGDPGGPIPSDRGVGWAPAEEARAAGLRLAWVYDRSRRTGVTRSGWAAPVSEALWADPALGPRITGLWSAPEPPGAPVPLTVQLAEGEPLPAVEVTEGARRRLTEGLGRELRLRLHLYADYPVGRRTQWERKPSVSSQAPAS